MKKLLCGMAGGLLLLGAGCARGPAEAERDAFHFPLVAPEHGRMQALLANALGYADPRHGLIDPASGYPVEGWNHEPERGLYLRSFTQLTAIGEWLELLANIAAGYADNSYVSREEALTRMEKTVASLLADQTDPAVSAKGLLGNFLGLEADRRVGPLSEEVEKKKFLDAFGAEPGAAVWDALAARGWIVPQQDGSFAKIPRKGEYGAAFFTGELAPYADEPVRRKIMELLDVRTVQIIFGDNANLTASAAKAFGALLHSSLRGDPAAERLRGQLEQFIARQEEGYRFLYSPEERSFAFGWNAVQNRFTGWEDSEGRWVTGRMNYLINEFRGPLLFVVQRFELPADAVRSAGLRIKPYRMADGRDLYAAAAWDGSAFQMLGLSLFMQELDEPGWREILENTVAIELDYAARHRLPGFLSESYSGRGVEYTGEVGIPELAVSDHPRLTHAPSLYTLGTAYAVAPDAVEAFLDANWKAVSALFTGHGPWEGTDVRSGEPIRFQTSAHTLTLILGGVGSAAENMQRYLTWQGVVSLERVTGAAREDGGYSFLADRIEWIPWSPSGDALELRRTGAACVLRGEAVRRGALTLRVPLEQGVNLSNGALLLRYRSGAPLPDAALTLESGPRVFPNRIDLRLEASSEEREVRIPLPAVPGLEQVKELVLQFGGAAAAPVDLEILRFEFIPGR